MHLVLFDIDGTLVESYDFDTKCFQAAVHEVLGVTVGPDWGQYRHVTDAGILSEVIERLDIQNDRERIQLAVKKSFLRRTAEHLSLHGAVPIPGAQEFIASLQARPEVSMAFATGGWAETARMKLEAAGLNFPAVPLVSSADHFQRIKIMELAEARAQGDHYSGKTYFGDGPWDQVASDTLGYNFVLVGKRINSPQAIRDFTETDRALAYIGLS